jgi:hypothetical protein
VRFVLHNSLTGAEVFESRMEPRFTVALRLRRREAMPNVLSSFNDDEHSLIATPQQRCNEVVMLYRVRRGSEGENYRN